MHERRRVGEELVDDPARRSADRGVTPRERRDAFRRKVGNDPQEVEERERESRGEHAEAEQPVPFPNRVPDPEAADRERDTTRLPTGSEPASSTTA